jgi:hypothetical protein
MKAGQLQESLDPKTVRRACSHSLSHNYSSSPREVLADLAVWTNPQWANALTAMLLAERL